jgi:hypothetical protein
MSLMLRANICALFAALLLLPLAFAPAAAAEKHRLVL